MWDLYRLAFLSQQDGDVLRRELDLLYPGVEIELADATSYLVIGYYANQLSEFRKFVEGLNKHA